MMSACGNPAAALPPRPSRCPPPPDDLAQLPAQAIRLRCIRGALLVTCYCRGWSGWSRPPWPRVVHCHYLSCDQIAVWHCLPPSLCLKLLRWARPRA